MSARTFVVLGATGNVGKQAAATLLAAGHHVRVPLRNIESEAAKALKNAGATVIASGFVPGDEKLGGLSIDESILTEAFRGSEGAFVLLPPNLASLTPEEQANNFIEIVKRAALASKLPKIVLLSSIGAHVPSGTGNLETLHHLEQTFFALAHYEFQVVSVRAGYFFTNLETSLPSVLESGVVALPLHQDVILPFLATEDIGDEVASQLVSLEKTENSSHIVELAGPTDYTYEGATQQIASVLGKEVGYVQVPGSDFFEVLLTVGYSKPSAEAFSKMAAFADSGKLAFEHNDKVVRRSRPLHQWLTAQLVK